MGPKGSRLHPRGQQIQRSGDQNQRGKGRDAAAFLAGIPQLAGQRGRISGTDSSITESAAPERGRHATVQDPRRQFPDGQAAIPGESETDRELREDGRGAAETCGRIAVGE